MLYIVKWSMIVYMKLKNLSPIIHWFYDIINGITIRFVYKKNLKKILKSKDGI